MGGELVDLDLAKLSDVANLLTFEGTEVGRDSASLQVHDAGEGLVEEGSYGQDGKVAGLGLLTPSAGESMALQT